MGRFRDALAGPGLAAVAEVKRRSPSAGDLRPDADPARLASSFERAGAAAVSILVDERFAGTVDDLRNARAVTSLPLLDSSTFLIVNGDTLVDLDVGAMVAAHARSGALVTMAAVPNETPDKYGGIVRGDLGLSLVTRQPVAAEIVRRIPISAQVAMLAVTFASLVIA